MAFPLISVTTTKTPMSELEMRKLERRVHEESDIIMDEYASLRSRTEQYLYDIQCHVKQLLVCIMDVRYVKILSKKSPLNDLEGATCISDVFLVLIKKNLLSFLQISILKRIITNLCHGSRKLQESLKAYEINFEQYIRNRVCKISVYREGRFEMFTSGEKNERVDLLLITDENWNEDMEFMKILKLEKTVAKCLGFDDFHLHLEAIQSQCLRVCYSISIHIAKSVFPLMEEELDELKSHGIAVLKCLEYHYTPTAKGVNLVHIFISNDWQCIY